MNLPEERRNKALKLIPLEEIATAHEKIESGLIRGCVVVTI